MENETEPFESRSADLRSGATDDPLVAYPRDISFRHKCPGDTAVAPVERLSQNMDCPHR